MELIFSPGSPPKGKYDKKEGKESKDGLEDQVKSFAKDFVQAVQDGDVESVADILMAVIEAARG
jgi:hypothetical protein